MSNTQNNPADRNELLDLKRQARTNALRLKIAQQNAALAALRSQGYSDKLEGSSYSDPSNYVDYRDYLYQSPPFFGALPTTRNDRDQGRDFPIFQTEQELAVIRGAARLVTACNPIAVGILTSLTNYVIGNGFHYAVAPRDAGAAAMDLAKIASAVIDDFLDQNNWSGDLDRELFQRSRVDGEYFLSLWHVGDGRVQARAVEPDQVTQPTNPAGLDQWLSVNQKTDWTFGVQSDADDAQAIHGFYVQWTNRDQDWDFLPGGNEPILPPGGAGSWMEHAKLNVVRSVKRGLSDFYAIGGNLEIARRVLRNMGEGSAMQAAIAWIQEVAPGTTQAQVNTGTMMRADASYTTQSQTGSRQHWLQQYDPATILKVPSGQKYLPGPLGAQHAPNFITAAQALLRSVAVRWSLPETFVTGTAENNNFASSLVAESPFVKFAESQQQFYAQRDRRTFERVLWFAWMAGRFGDVEWDAIKRSLRIEVTPPQIEVRDPEKETAVRKTLHDAGLLSRKTWSAQEGLDYEQEQKNLEQEAETASTPERASAAGSKPIAKIEDLVDLLERFWDASKHPRGGFPQNRGWFSPTSGSGAEANDHQHPANVNDDDNSAAIARDFLKSSTTGTSPQNEAPSGDDRLQDVPQVCFRAGTPISIDGRAKAIEKIAVGQQISCVPEGNPYGAVVLRKVIATHCNGAQPLVRICAGALELFTTFNHPFWAEGRGWTSAGKLRAGDLLRTREGSTLAVTEIGETGVVEPVYNLTVEDYHTYFVGSPDGAGSVLAHNDSPQEPAPSEKERLSREDLLSYFKLLYGPRGQKLLKAFEKSEGIVKIENVWFGKSDLDSRDIWGPQQIQIDELLNPAEAAQELMERLLEASGLTEVRQHLSHSGFDNIDILIESYRQSFKQAAATVALAAELYLSGISVVNEGADWVVTINDLSEGNYYAAIAFLPFIPAAVGKSGVILKHGKQTLRVSAETIQKIKALPVDELISLLESTRKLARNMEKANIVRPANTAAHHIVPVTLKKFKDAVAARAILTKFGIGIENAANGVYLPSKFDEAVKAAYHGSIHTETYYKELLKRLRKAQSKEQALIILGTIRNELLSGKFPH